MYLNQFESTSEARLQRILATLNDVHGVHIKIDLSSPSAESAINECQVTWEATRRKIVSESSFNSYQQNPQYTKAMLILEAMKIMLTEIGPKRRRKSKMNESTTEEAMEGKPTISTQLSDISAKIPQDSQQASAFSNALSSIADKLSSKGAAFTSGVSNLDQDEKSIMLWIKGLPRPVNVGNLVKDGIAKFGQDLLAKRMSHIEKLPKVDTDEALSIMKAKPSSKANPGMDNVHEQMNESDTLSQEVLNTPNMPGNATFSQAHHYEYQASMARSELYRNSKYAISMLKQVDPNSEIQPWIAGCLTKAASMLDKVYHYLDYYKTFEPDQLPEGIDGEMELGETSGSIARQNLMLIVEYSTKLFNLIKPGDKLEGWVAMKLTTASECISSSKHYMDYVQFEQHALDDHFEEARRSKRGAVAEAQLRENVDPNNEELAKATLIINAKTISGKVQDMAEDTAKLGVNELMPLVDSMRTQFGPDAASGFNETVKTALDTLLSVTTETKETIDAAITTLQGGGVPATPTDIEQAGPAEAPPDNTDISADMASMGAEEPAEEPESALGRAKKDELAETLAVGKKVNVTNPRATPRYEVVSINGDKITVKKPDGSEITLPKERIMRANPTLTEAKKKSTAKPDFLDVDNDGNKKEPFKKALKDKEIPEKNAKPKKGKVPPQFLKKGKVKESTVKCTECGTGTYMEDDNGKMCCNECGSMMMAEGWPGYRKKLADQTAKPSEADKKWNKITKINSEPPVVEGIFSKKPTPVVTRVSPPTASEIKAKDQLPLKKGEVRVTNVTPDMLKKDLNVPAYLRKGQNTEEVTEVAPPGKAAKKFIDDQTDAFKKRYGKKWEQVLYATAWKEFGPKHEGYKSAVNALAEANNTLATLAKTMSAHKSAFKRMVSEGQTTDPLNVGYGLEGETIRHQMILAKRKIAEQTSVVRQIMQEGVIGMLKNIEMLNKVKELELVKNQTPFGVIYETKSGRKSKKMFENSDTRKYWLDLNSSKISNVRMVEPETFDAAINKKLKV